MCCFHILLKTGLSEECYVHYLAIVVYQIAPQI